ncbi:MAG: hypothetical protein U0795_20110 [Pirellulales bacterium]
MSREDVIRQLVERAGKRLNMLEDSAKIEVPELYQAANENFGTWDTALQYAGINVPRPTRKRFDKGCIRSSKPDNAATDVLRRIRRLISAGYELSEERTARRDPDLYESCRREFGSWRQALAKAGVKVQNLEKSHLYRSYSRNAFLEDLRRRHEQGTPLEWGEISRSDHSFALGIKRRFGSWHNALVLAGVPVSGSRRSRVKWSPERVLAEIRDRHRNGMALASNKLGKEDRALVAAAQGLFGSWNAAVAAAVPSNDA